VNASSVHWFKTSFAAALLALVTSPSGANAYAVAARFTTEHETQLHSPTDAVVWVNLPTGVYHFKGQRWYGNTKSGAYECLREADLEGSRPTHNRQ